MIVLSPLGLVMVYCCIKSWQRRFHAARERLIDDMALRFKTEQAYNDWVVKNHVTLADSTSSGDSQLPVPRNGDSATTVKSSHVIDSTASNAIEWTVLVSVLILVTCWLLG